MKLLREELIRPQGRVSWKNFRAVPLAVEIGAFDGNDSKGLLPRQVDILMTPRDSEVLEGDSS
jgi:hypothetical protein